MPAVVELPAFAENLTKNPSDRGRMLAMDPEVFASTMLRWDPKFLQPPDAPIPGTTPADYAGIQVPRLAFRSGAKDLEHLRQSSEWAHTLIPNAQLIEPAFSDDEWNEQGAKTRATGENVLFANWPKLAPQILKFMSENPAAG
jgi:hypothetical protein